MQISCDCGKFRAELKNFPKNTPGRLTCYCDDCQAYLTHLGREDLLDENGGTEIIPAYPADFTIVSGAEKIKCTRLSEKGLFRFSTSCCNTPIANARPRLPWLGILRCAYANKEELDRELGPIRSRIMGKFAKGTPPKGTPQKFDLKGLRIVMPYLLKGKILRKGVPTPFFSSAGAPIVTPHVLSREEGRVARGQAISVSETLHG
jgi:hypothetical protein